MSSADSASRMDPNEPQKRRLLVVGPLPPPLHGVTISTSLVLENTLLAHEFEVVHVDTSDHRAGDNTGRWDWTNVSSGLGSLVRLVVAMRRTAAPGVLYLPLSQNRAAFLRDSLLVLVGAAFRWRVAVHLRGSDFADLYRSLGPLGRAWVRFTMNHVTSCAVMGRSLRHVFGGLLPADRIAVVPNGTPDPAHRADPETSSTILCLTNLRPRKGIEPAIEAARLVLGEMPEVRFRFAGAWENEAFRQSMLELSGNDPRIEFLPVVEGAEKDELIASAAVMLFCPVQPEGHPRVVLEALAAGVPLVTTDQGAIRETVENGESGFVLAEADPQEIAARVLLLMRQPRLRRDVGTRARERYETCFTQQKADETITGWLAAV